MQFPKLNSRPAHTLLFITDENSWRVDCDNKGIFLSEIEAFETGCKNISRLNICLEHIADKSAQFGRKLWLLLPKLPVTILSLSTMQVRGLAEENLMQVLQFELESMTGQSGLDMKLAYQLLSSQNEMNDYRVSYINQLDYEDLVNATKKIGSKLAGLIHPGGLPQCFNHADADDWLRIENWTDQLFTVRNNPEDGYTTLIYAKELSSWHAKLEQDLALPEPAQFSETLTNFDLEILPDTDVILDITQTDKLNILISAWANTLVSKNACLLPILKTHSKVNQDVLVMVGGGVTALLLCCLHFGWHSYQTSYYETERDYLKSSETMIKNMRKNIATLNTQRNELKRKQSEIESDTTTIPTLLDALKKRPSHLLHALAKGSNDGIIIESITQQGDQVSISGITLKASDANKLASYLTERLSLLGWQISAPEKTDMNLIDTGGPWEFNLQLTDLGILSFSKVTGNETL